MKEVTLRQLEYFVAVAEEESITKAAVKCHVSQAAISLALKELEASLGKQLVIRRKSKGVYLTRVGRNVAVRGRSILAESRQLLAAVESRSNSERTFAVGCFTPLSMRVIPEIAEYFTLWQPDVRLEIVEGAGQEIQERMLRGQLDMCVIYAAQLNADAQAEVIRRETFKIALSPAHPLASQPIVSLAELASFPAAVLNLEPASYMNEGFFRRYGHEPQVRFRSSSVHTIRALVGRNLAFAFLIQEVPESHEGRPIKYVPLVEDLGENSILAALPRGTRTSEFAGAAISRLRRALEQRES